MEIKVITKKCIRTLKRAVEVIPRSLMSLEMLANESEHEFNVTLAIVAIIKNEGEYIEEWVKYHLLVGVERIYLYDNGSDDNTKDVLEPFIKNGSVVYAPYPGTGMQFRAYNDAIRKHKNECEYIAFIDADEFLMPVKQGQNLTEVVKRIMGAYPKASGLAVNWRMFGSSGHIQKPAGGGIGKLPLAC